ncbi:hypothetical protein NEMIN01_0221 [Nematocida minor]|uniref:uncharacterized protein n=1 Tax=Nematocida minor TaxID=1912983 RepID=UPI002220BD61|nr:uncharacterized protein NEMIN01_0117 [Nematocida minor]XP_051332123.1 uncharacterized protein NEMIN01_0221 [Nematocida minor]KAI5188853.1 hypothetical protein NEMIN01_0117 [Nematocida minor]KAI5188957.1 hypothetical protein NEMIN01_0221 [Nematocida minor]
MDAEIYSIDYANNRASEIKEIERSIKETRKNKMLFQTLPFHKRRRTASFDERRLPKELRRGERTKRRRVRQTVKDQKNLLKAHTWYAKRFTMYKRKEMHLPFKRHSKSDSFIAKALNTRGVLCDISYNRVYLSEKKHPTGAVFDQTYNRAIFWSPLIEPKSHEKVQNNDLARRSIVITETLECLTTEPLETFREIENLSIFEIFGAQSLFSKTECVNCQTVEDLLSSTELAYICLRLQDRAYILVSRKHCMALLQKAVVSGIVPCSILELRRIATETERVVYPYDIPCHPQGKAFLEHIRTLQEEEQSKKPKGKKEVVFLPIYENTLEKQTMALFQANKGSFPSRSPVVQSEKTDDFAMSGAEEVIGEVGRSSFSFAKGKTAGLIYIDENVKITKNLFIRNLKNKTFRKIEYQIVDSTMML